MKTRHFLALSLCAVSMMPLAQTAQAVEAIELQVSRVGDIELDCGALSQEAVLMRDIITTTQDIQDDTTMKGHGITAAGAVGSFLVGTATGGIGLAAAGFLLNRANDEQAEEAGSVQNTAAQRRALMMGIYNAKGCFGPVDHAMQDGMEHNEVTIQVAAVEPQAGNQDETLSTDEEKPRYNH